MTVIANLTEAERVTMAEILRTHPRVRGESEAQHRMSAEQAAKEAINAQRTEYDPEGEKEPLEWDGDEWPPPQWFIDQAD